ncbi:phage/plasmid replication protein, II/X family [Vibrio scophthalmi]|uniref:Replication protein n=1 Tax=Vibrio scophthalmi LMG 19158 TaxID=870967 RepID=F9RK37_9VIBR|nr:phage/plasmid replication protein, II/X family [Vibrio scophthalmi]EGU40196.1 replication protein [Vibrio scophthalmi LMG 19158]
MIDKLKISIPFKRKYVTNTRMSKTGECIEYVNIIECSRRGIGLEAKSVHYKGGALDNCYEVADLRHPYESLPTHYTGMAMKIFQGTTWRSPCIELKCSPAKIVQGHNVFGSTSIALGADEMLCALQEVYPRVWEMLDYTNSTLDAIDVTYSARVSNELHSKQVINCLKNVSNGQMRKSVRNEFETTCYFTQGSRHCDRKAYLKSPEFQRQLNSLRSLQEKGITEFDRVIDVMSDPRLINFARNLVRFEAGAHRRYLDTFDIPKNLFQAIQFQFDYEKNGNSLIQDIWQKAFNPLLQALEGQRMNIFNDEEVHTKLKEIHMTLTPKGNVSFSKADRVFRFYRSLVADGYDSVKDTFSSRATFYRQLNELLSAGFSKAQLQNLQGHGHDNVVPLLQVIDVDFSNQRPEWYVEPEIGELSKKYGFNTANVFRLTA